MDADGALQRLRDPNDPALSELIGIAVAHVRARSAVDLVDANTLGPHVAGGLRAFVSAPGAQRELVSRIEAARERVRHEERPLGAWIPSEVDATARTLLKEPWVPGEALTFQVINHDALRAMLREILTSAVSRFATRIRAVDQGVLGGLGGKVARRGRGLLGSVGAAAEGIVGAVRDEVEGAVEGRVREFVGGATEDAVRGIARWLADPAHADSLAAMRVSVLDVLLDVPVRQLVGEVDELDTAHLVGVVWQGLEQLAARDDLDALVSQALGDVLHATGGDTIGSLADGFGVSEVLQQGVVDTLLPQARAVLVQEEFAAWWQRLHSS